MSQTPATTSSTPNIENIFNAALESYKKKTKKDLKEHDLFKQLEGCDSPTAILAKFLAEHSSQTDGDDKLKKWLIPTANVLCAFSETLGAGVSLVFPPAAVIFSGVGVLLLAAKDVAGSQDILVNIFGRIESFLGRLEEYTAIPLTSAMMKKMIEITVEVLDILATATKEMKQSRAKKFVKRLAGRTDSKDGLKKLEMLKIEELVNAIAQLTVSTQNIDDNVTAVGNDVRGVDQKVQVVNDNIKAVADDGKQVKVTATKVQLIVEKMADDVDDVKRNQLRETLRKWQSPPDPSTNHNIASDRQHEGTAEWFFKDEKFKEWKVTGSLLWIHGKPGSGKSVLCSAIIKDITTLCKTGSALMAYFYFDFQNDEKRVRRGLLSSLLTQLSSRSNTFCDILSRLHKAHNNGESQPNDDALMQCLKEMLTLSSHHPVYLILDALDECPDTSGFPSARALVLDLVKDLANLRLSSLHICVTSRPEVDIIVALESLADHTVSLQDERGQMKDIADYVRSVVHSGSSIFMKSWKQEDKEHAIETLTINAGGMFRWVFCQLEMLQNCLPQNIRRVLRELPESLDETYERVLKGIGRANRPQAHRLLQCLTVATRPLRVEELAEVLALDFDGAKEGIPVLNKDWRSDDQQLEQGVLSTCSSLIVIVHDHYGFFDDRRVPGDVSSRRVVQFAHFSVKEFLTSDRLADLKGDISRFHISLEPAHTIMAQACLEVLLQSDDNNANNDVVKGGSPLARYAVRYWVMHAQFEKVSSRVEDGMRRLFDPVKPYFAAWLKSHNIDEEWPSFRWNSPPPSLQNWRHASLRPIREDRAWIREDHAWIREDHASLCLYYASLCGFRDLVTHLIAKDPQHVDARVGLNKSPLAAALRNRHFQVAELLHQHGASLRVFGDHGRTLLHVASMDGLVDVAQWLLNVGADANAANQAHQTRLHEASASGHVDIVRLLIQDGADANGDLQELLRLAVLSGSAETVQLFIQLGADVHTQDKHQSTLLHQASSLGTAKSVWLLIGHGVDVNARDQSHSTPLHLASYLGKAKTVRLLAKHGADVNARDQNQQTPLHLASSRGELEHIRLFDEHGGLVPAAPRDPEFTWNSETVRLLIEHGADVNVQDQYHSTPLHLASSRGIAENVQLLIEHGADVNTRDGDQSTPLHLASSAFLRAKNVRLLLEHGADVNVRDQNNSTPLHLALSFGQEEHVRLLVEHRADVNARNQKQQTPLHLALSRGRAETVRLFIEHGADVNAQDQNHSTPLHLASSQGKANIVQLFIEHGADVNARDQNHSTPLHLALSCGKYPTPLHLASSQGEANIVQLFIEHGADVNARDQNQLTPLHLASSSWSAETVQLLIEHGAGVNAQDQNRSTPLHLASSQGEAEIVQLLITHGADVNARDQDHSTPLHLALSVFKRNHDAEIAQLLIEHGADVNAWDQNHLRPLQMASFRGIVEIVQLLITHGADVNARYQDHSTPLHLALSVFKWAHDAEIAQLSDEDEDEDGDQDQDQDQDAWDQNHSTPLQRESSWGIAKIVQLLIEHGADVNARDQNQQTPWHLALSLENAEIVQLLIEHGADVNTEDGGHSTPLHPEISRQQPVAGVVRLLVEHGANVL